MQVKRKRLRADGPATRLGLGLAQSSSVRIPALLRQTRRLSAIPTEHVAAAELKKEPHARAPSRAPEPTPPAPTRINGTARGHRPAPRLPPLPTLPSKRRERTSTAAPTPSTASAHYLQPGFRLAAYTILRRSNEGGTCEIYHVYHPKLSLRAIARVARRTVLEAHPWIRERMLNNAEVIAESNHSNLMRILDFGETSEAAPRPFVITERIVGRDLAVYLASHGQLPVATVIDIGLQITRGLTELYRLGLSHGDLKPSNVMISLRIDGSLRIVLIDFDLARHQEAPRAPGLSPGTPNYLPPEHSIGMRPSIHFDIYALGVILHELLLGECPVDEQRCLAAIEDQTEWPMICPLHIEHPELGVPRSLSRLIARLTHHDRCRRPKSLAAVERSIERLLTTERSPAARDNPPLTLRQSVSACVNVALSTAPQGSGALAPLGGQTRLNTAALASTPRSGPTPDLPRAILPLIVSEADNGAPAQSWHHGELLDQPTYDERVSSPLRELRRGRLATMLALGAIVAILGIVTGAARVVAKSGTPTEDLPQESLIDGARDVLPVPRPQPLALTGEDESGSSRSSDPDLPKDERPTVIEPPEAHSPNPAPSNTSSRRSRSAAKKRVTQALAGASKSRPSRASALLPVPRSEDVDDRPAAQEGSGVELESLADTDPVVRPTSPPSGTPPITVPKLTGMHLDGAKALLRGGGIGYRVHQVAAGACFFREGEVVAQSFAPGTAIARNLEITIDYCTDEENEREEEKRHGHATDQRQFAPEHQNSP